MNQRLGLGLGGICPRRPATGPDPNPNPSPNTSPNPNPNLPWAALDVAHERAPRGIPDAVRRPKESVAVMCKRRETRAAWVTKGKGGCVGTAQGSGLGFVIGNPASRLACGAGVALPRHSCLG